MPSHLTSRDRKELTYLMNLDSTTPYITRQRKNLLDAIKSDEAERTGTRILEVCTNTRDEQGKITKRRKIGFLQREKGRRKGKDFYFKRGYKINGLFHQIESLFNLENATREYAYLEKHHQ